MLQLSKIILATPRRMCECPIALFYIPNTAFRLLYSLVANATPFAPTTQSKLNGTSYGSLCLVHILGIRYESCAFCRIALLHRIKKNEMEEKNEETAKCPIETNVLTKTSWCTLLTPSRLNLANETVNHIFARCLCDFWKLNIFKFNDCTPSAAAAAAAARIVFWMGEIWENGVVAWRGCINALASFATPLRSINFEWNEDANDYNYFIVLHYRHQAAIICCKVKCRMEIKLERRFNEMTRNIFQLQRKLYHIRHSSLDARLRNGRMFDSNRKLKWMHWDLWMASCTFSVRHLLVELAIYASDFLTAP